MGVGLRVVTQVAYWPTLLFEDSYIYLHNVQDLDPGNPRPIGYPIFLRLLLHLPDLAAVPIAQHLLGLAMGVVTYVLLLRWGAWRPLAALAAVPVLWDAYQLEIEHMVMSDCLFQALVLAALALLAWRRRPTIPAVTVAGLLLGLSVYVRIVGQPLIVPALLLVLFVLPGWRRRLAAALVVVIAFAVPIMGYMAYYHSQYGAYALSDMGGRVQYARVARFVQCEQLPSLPAYEKPLCPREPPSERLPPNGFVWDPRSPARQYEAPPGISKKAVLKDFSKRAVLHQPIAFLGGWLHDFTRYFYPRKTTHPPEVPVVFWHFPEHFRDWNRDRHAGTAVLEYGSSGAYVNDTLAGFLRSYQLTAGYTPGTVLGIAVLAGLAGMFGLGRARRSGMRTVCFSFTSSGAGLLLAAASFEFSWRYELPALVLLPIAGALGATAVFRGGPRRYEDSEDSTAGRARARVR